MPAVAQLMPINSAKPENCDPSGKPAGDRAGFWRWWIAIILFLATVLTYLDRQTLSLCGPMICGEFGLSNEDFGKLVAAFRWAYAVVHVPAGFIADRLSLRMTYSAAVAFWSLAGAAAALVSNGRQLLAARAMLGVGEAFNWPCATRIMANVLPPQDRGLGSGIFNSGAAVGSLVAPLLITPLAIQFGWRAAFVAIGAVGFLWVPLWLWATQKTRVECQATRQSPARRRVGLSGVTRWMRDVLLQPGFWLLLVIGITVNPCWYFLNEWIPKYMHDKRDLSYLSAGLVTIPIFIGADLGNLLSGAMIKYLVFRGWSLRKARGTTLTLAASLIAPAALLPLADQTWIAVCILGFAALGITSFAANYTACQQDFSFANVGIVAGILGMSCNVIAAGLNPWIGRYVDATGNYTLIFLLIGALPVVSLGAVLTFDAMLHREDK